MTHPAFQPVDDRFKVCPACGLRCTLDVDEATIKNVCDPSRQLLRTPVAPRGPCVHRGEEKGRVECASCQGKVELKVFHCAIHGECILEQPKKPIQMAACKGCTDSIEPRIEAAPPHPNAGNWWHDEGRVAYKSAEPAAAISKPRRRKSALLLRFKHGLGDHAMFSIVLRHLRELRPDLDVDVECKADCVAALAGVCRRAFALDREEEPVAYDLRYRVPFFECDRVWPDGRTSKWGKSLWEVHGLVPRPELCRYVVATNPAAEATAERVVGAIAAEQFALVHYLGATGKTRKDLPADVVLRLCETLRDAGIKPVVLHWSGAAPLRRIPWLMHLGSDVDLWGQASGADVTAIAALARRAALCVGIDSGPGHVFGATETPTVITWTKHHPVHFYGLSPNVVHLLPRDHERNIHGDPAVCRDWFFNHYRQSVYDDLARDLPRAATALAGTGSSSLSE